MFVKIARPACIRNFLSLSWSLWLRRYLCNWGCIAKVLSFCSVNSTYIPSLACLKKSLSLFVLLIMMCLRRPTQTLSPRYPALRQSFLRGPFYSAISGFHSPHLSDEETCSRACSGPFVYSLIPQATPFVAHTPSPASHFVFANFYDQLTLYITLSVAIIFFQGFHHLLTLRNLLP